MERGPFIVVVWTGRRRNLMCDYSLESVASRPAVVADRLITAHFATTITGGFASTEDPCTAVCLLPGTEIAFDHEPKYRRSALLWCRTATATGKVARFRQIDLGVRNAHHDALEFSDGMIVLLTQLLPGQRAILLQLPKDSQNTIEGKAEPIPAFSASQDCG